MKDHNDKSHFEDVKMGNAMIMMMLQGELLKN